MSGKHTPGPWEALTDNNAKVWLIMPIAVAVDGAADARLIAAAPDLLASLKVLYAYLVAIDEDGLTEHAEVMAQARAALSRASTP